MPRLKKKNTFPTLRVSPVAVMTLPFLLLMAALAVAVVFHTSRGEETALPQALDKELELIAIEDYLAALLINEVPFPGEPAFKNAADSKAAMEAIVWTIHSRRAPLPTGYTRRQVAATPSTNLIDILTAANQMEGFFKTDDDRHAFAPRVKERVDYLNLLGQRDDTPTITELLDYAYAIAHGYVEGNALPFADPFAGLTHLSPDDVTGSPYGWMTDDPAFHPGGNFIRIPDDFGGSLGGNRFFTLRKTPLPPPDDAKNVLDDSPAN